MGTIVRIRSDRNPNASVIKEVELSDDSSIHSHIVGRRRRRGLPNLLPLSMFR